MQDVVVISGGMVVTMDAQRRVLDRADLLVERGRIAAIGEVAVPPGAQRIDASGMIVLPGLIDAHAHAGHSLVKTLGGGDSARWTEAVEEIYPRGTTTAFWAADGALAALERLKAGITTGLAVFGAYGSRTDAPDYAQAHAAAYRHVGVRLVICPGVSPPPYPNRFARWDGDAATPLAITLDDQLRVCEALVGTLHGAADAMTHVMLAAPVAFPGRPGVTAELLAGYADAAISTRVLSRSLGVGFTQDGHRAGTVRVAAEQGLLGPDALLSHCIDIDAEEQAAIIASGAKVAHNPSANFSILGRCPAIELMAAGGTVAICSDGTAPDRPFDLFRHMQQAMHYHRRHFRDAQVLPPGKALEMVTIDAARALGLEAEIGSLEAGKRADIVLVDMQKPHLFPPDMPLYRLVCFANAADVDTVLVEGRVVMSGRAVPHVDQRAVLADAAREITAAIARSGMQRMSAMPDGFWRRTRYGA